MTTGSMWYPQNVSADLVMFGQYAWLMHMRYLVMYVLPMLPSGS